MKPLLKLASSAATMKAVIPGARPDRGFLAVYRPGESNRCPGCGGQNWLVGRTTAECAFCATAVPIASDGKVQ